MLNNYSDSDGCLGRDHSASALSCAERKLLTNLSRSIGAADFSGVMHNYRSTYSCDSDVDDAAILQELLMPLRQGQYPYSLSSEAARCIESNIITICNDDKCENESKCLAANVQIYMCTFALTSQCRNWLGDEWMLSYPALYVQLARAAQCVDRSLAIIALEYTCELADSSDGRSVYSPLARVCLSNTLMHHARLLLAGSLDLWTELRESMISTPSVWNSKPMSAVPELWIGYLNSTRDILLQYDKSHAQVLNHSRDMARRQ